GRARAAGAYASGPAGSAATRVSRAAGGARARSVVRTRAAGGARATPAARAAVRVGAAFVAVLYGARPRTAAAAVPAASTADSPPVPARLAAPRPRHATVEPVRERRRELLAGVGAVHGTA